jgi:hypothetical protein
MPFGLRKKKAQVTVDRQRQVDVCYAIKQIGMGNLSFIEGHDPAKPIILSFQNMSLTEPRLIQGTAESSIKNKISKGLYFYVGQAQEPSPTEELVQIDNGTTTIAPYGIIFAGKSKRISVNFDDIDTIGHTNNGITISSRSQLERLRLEGADRTTVPLKVQDRTYRQTLSGKLMRILIEAAMKTSLERRGEN